MQDQLREVERLVRNGGDDDLANAVAAIREELDLLTRPPSWYRRTLARLLVSATVHWERFVQELRETRSAFTLIDRRLRGEIGTLTAEQRREIRSQIADILKTIPGSALFVGMFFLPVPGAQPVLTPIVLKRLGLLPSAWRESYLLAALRQTEARLRGRDRSDLADRLAVVTEQVEHDVVEREQVRQFLETNPDFQILFEEDFDGHMSPTELDAAVAALRTVLDLARAHANEPRWYAFVGDTVVGPYRLDELDVPEIVEGGLVSYERNGSWAPLEAVLERLGAGGAGSSRPGGKSEPSDVPRSTEP